MEAYLGLAISLIIVKSGYDMLSETLSKILGEKTDKDEIAHIIDEISSFPEVISVRDFVVNDYGPDKYYSSCHIEVDSRMTAEEIDVLLRNISQRVYLNTGCIMIAIGIYSINNIDEDVRQIREKIAEEVTAIPHVVEIHGFHADIENRQLRFDVVISFDSQDRSETYAKVCSRVKELYPDYDIHVIMDTEFI